jgi:hypothetical protein
MKNVPEVALMLYGVLNTHGEIHDPVSGLQSLQQLLLQMATEKKIALEIFVHTEDKCFFKWTPVDKIDPDFVRGFPRIANVEDRYLVCQYDADCIEKDLSKVYGHYLKKIHIDQNAFSLEEWASTNENYNRRGTSNKWRNTMIEKFLKRKNLVFKMAVDTAEIEKKTFDSYILARPDSCMASYVAKSPEKTQLELLKYFQECQNSSDAIVFYQRCSVHPDSLRENPHLSMLANDFVIGNKNGIQEKVSLIDYIENECGGNFFEVYTEPVYSCRKCYYMYACSSKPKKCSKCSSTDMLLVTEWPEYKMFQHILKNGVVMLPAAFRCKVFR